MRLLDPFLYSVNEYVHLSIAHSIHAFYGNICSGLSEETKLSFISSNSSFNECVRKHIISPHLLSNGNDNDDSCRTDCTFLFIIMYLFFLPKIKFVNSVLLCGESVPHIIAQEYSCLQIMIVLSP